MTSGRKVMMRLGAYAFSLDTAAYAQLEHAAAFRWAALDRHGREAALQYLGPGEETISLSGVVYPHCRGGVAQVAAMRDEAARGEPLLLVDGLGKVHGLWAVQKVTETRRVLFADGTPRRIEFTLAMRYYGEA